jgi:hypothetical protein
VDAGSYAALVEAERTPLPELVDVATFDLSVTRIRTPWRGVPASIQRRTP